MLGTIIITIFILGPVGVLSQSAENNSISERIIGGHSAAEGQFPYQVSIRVNGKHECGGSIISSFWILTAAHCVARYPLGVLLVVVGTNHVKLGTPYGVAQVFVHEQYESQTKINDIGLIKLAGRINFNAKIKPIQLSTSLQPPGTSCVLSGWGFTNVQTQTIPDSLQYIGMRIVSVERCRAAISAAGLNMPVVDTQVCAFNAPGRGACNADSGGPLVCNGVQYGIVSWGNPCATGVPDVFTSVAANRKWIAIKSGV
ncbi:hypothetical protein ILUMI_22404 [Ignelater luminosus]|uniref:Peptidase S1 domain-containing protein n=1 Tax=Ignelater luminosus TaxID=2038154 RepID=A0A8K0CEG5_IGNLU|nr:hypothetical protein ILUMI_22404 [Ignelater luminosus]